MNLSESLMEELSLAVALSHCRALCAACLWSAQTKSAPHSSSYPKEAWKAFTLLLIYGEKRKTINHEQKKKSPDFGFV